MGHKIINFIRSKKKRLLCMKNLLPLAFYANTTHNDWSFKKNKHAMRIPCNNISLLFLLATVSVTNTKTRLQGHRSQVNSSILSTAPGQEKKSHSEEHSTN